MQPEQQTAAFVYAHLVQAREATKRGLHEMVAVREKHLAIASQLGILSGLVVTASWTFAKASSLVESICLSTAASTPTITPRKLSFRDRFLAWALSGDGIEAAVLASTASSAASEKWAAVKCWILEWLVKNAQFFTFVAVTIYFVSLTSSNSIVYGASLSSVLGVHAIEAVAGVKFLGFHGAAVCVWWASKLGLIVAHVAARLFAEQLKSVMERSSMMARIAAWFMLAVGLPITGTWLSIELSR